MSFASEMKDFVTALDFLRYGVSRARAVGLHYGHGTDNAVDDIRMLVLETLHLPWDIESHYLDARLSPAEIALLSDRLEQRIIKRVPVPYITQTAYFCDLCFYVDPRVLIPRSPIAELIQQQFAPWVEAECVTRILDLCTGSGCIAIACCAWFPSALVDAVDLSSQALAVAEINRERHQVQDQLTLIQSDCFDEVPRAVYDVIVTNPPYVAESVMRDLPSEYFHEPTIALQAEQSGLAIIHRILKEAGAYLSEQGILIVEVGESAETLIEAYSDLPFIWLEFAHGGDGVFLLTASMLRDYWENKR